MKNTIKTIIFLTNFILVIQANAQQTKSMAAVSNEQKVTLSATEQKRFVKKLYYKNGAIKEVKHLVGNVVDGTWSHFYANGQIHKEGAFFQGKEHGIWKTYSETGVLTRIERYENGIEQGEWKAFHTDGTLAVSGTFINGKRQGQWKVYTTDGLLEKIVTFQDDNDTQVAYVQEDQLGATSHTSVSTLE